MIKGRTWNLFPNGTQYFSMKCPKIQIWLSALQNIKKCMYKHRKINIYKNRKEVFFCFSAHFSNWKSLLFFITFRKIEIFLTNFLFKSLKIFSILKTIENFCRFKNSIVFFNNMKQYDDLFFKQSELTWINKLLKIKPLNQFYLYKKCSKNMSKNKSMLKPAASPNKKDVSRFIKLKLRDKFKINYMS